MDERILPAAVAPRLDGWVAWIRRQFRASEAWFVLLAVAVGGLAGAATVVQGALARTLQHWLFALPPMTRLSGMPALGWAQLAVLPIGGAVLAIFSRLVHAQRRPLVDAVEANALHGGRMTLPDSAVVAGQTLISNGFGASVGLEAAYAQVGGAAASYIGRMLNVRRSDLRTLVGAGAGAAIAAAFGAPLTGAFYAFEIVIGAYTPSAIAPVAAAALAGTLVAQGLGSTPYLVAFSTGAPVHTVDYLVFAGLGALSAALGILLMRGVALVETATRQARLPTWSRPVIGGVLMIPIAMVSPQVLSSGHAALSFDLAAGAGVGFILLLIAAKSLASIVSLGFGFRGGLFFASLFLGSLVGHAFAAGLNWAAGFVVIDPPGASLVGMAALAVAIVGGPLTMAMLVLEATNDFALTGAVLAAALVTSLIVRETFGYSFSTWRLHLRGETIKSARDIGWIKTLTAGQMMRRGTASTAASTSIGDFRQRFPLGATSRVVLVGADGRYAGIVVPALAYAEGVNPTAAIGTLAAPQDLTLSTDADIGQVMAMFDHAESDELAVVDAGQLVLGVLSETFVRRRYAEELEKAQRELYGER
ncbi:MAG: chloride channel protein [Janthinobacterium lividum]